MFTYKTKISAYDRLVFLSGKADAALRLPAIQVLTLIAATSGMLFFLTLWQSYFYDAIPQRAILDERSLDGVQGTRTNATVTWSLAEDEAGSPILLAHLSVRRRGLNLVLSIRKNLDGTVPTSHIVEILAETSPESSGRRITGIPFLALKKNDEVPATRLTGVATKVSDNHFKIALSPSKENVASNLGLLRRARLIDLPLTYASGQNAILTFPKGGPGERLLRAAMLAWAKRQAGSGAKDPLR